jgi:hypothetical protein
MPQADSQKAIRVMIFPEMQRGTSEGHYPEAPSPARLDHDQCDGRYHVSAVEGEVLTVKYKGGTQKIIIGKDALIVSMFRVAWATSARRSDRDSSGAVNPDGIADVARQCRSRRLRSVIRDTLASTHACTISWEDKE